MNLKDLLVAQGIDPQRVLVLRHRPLEPELNKVLPWLAAERPDVFNAYQQTQTRQVEIEMTRAGYVAAFIGHEPGHALFAGLYSVEDSKPITPKQYRKIKATRELEAFGHAGFTEASSHSSILWFDLAVTDFHADWKGKLIIRWPPLDKNWHRWAHKPNNSMPILAILDESALDAAMPDWGDIELTWEELSVLPARWKLRLQEWRAIYYIFDMSLDKGYVGSAYGKENLLQRWVGGYGSTGHCGNRLLRQCEPKNFRFSILQRLAPDMPVDDVLRLESSWKKRLHTRHPHGLNDN